MQAELGAPPEHIIGAGSPFVLAQVVEFGLVQTRRDFVAQVGERARMAQHQVDASTVGAGEAMPQAPGQPVVARCQRLLEALEMVSGRVAVPIPAERSPPGRYLPRVQPAAW